MTKAADPLTTSDLKDVEIQDFSRHSPLVFMFQPTKYVVVPNERLAEWEALMVKRVGIKPDLHGATPRRMPSRTLSGCGSGWGDADDCDVG